MGRASEYFSFCGAPPSRGCIMLWFLRDIVNVGTSMLWLLQSV
jgi:hypothetical protein